MKIKSFLLLLFVATAASAKPVKLSCFFYDAAKQTMTLDPFTQRIFLVDGDAKTVRLNGVSIKSEWTEDQLTIEEADVTNADSAMAEKLVSRISRLDGDLVQTATRRHSAGVQSKVERRDIRLGKCAERKTIF